MKKLYAIAATLLLAVSAQATIHMVTVANNTFTPQAFTAQVGDTVRWVLSAGTHTTTGTASTIPAGANPWNQTLSSVGQTFDYKIMVSGNYGYVCSFHPGMVGGFSAAAPSSITTPSISSVLNVYPNPCKDKITVSHGSIDAITVFNMVGEKVETMNIEASETKTTLELTDLSTGVYFLSTMKDGAILETKRIVKTR
jgi:plastocyanin